MAARTGLTACTLRHYDQLGVFCPAEVDADGRRRCALDQLLIAFLLGRLGSAGVPLDGVQLRLAAGGDLASVAEVRQAHDRRLESRYTKPSGDRPPTGAGSRSTSSTVSGHC